MRTNPFNDAWDFFWGNTPDHINNLGGALRYLFIVIFWAALAASIWIARRNWQQDPAQRTSEHLWTYGIRVLMGCMWFQGSLWKLPLPLSGGLKFWLEEEIPHAAFRWHAWLIQHVVAPNLYILNTPIFLIEFCMGIAFILGFMVRPAALVGILFTLQLWLGLYLHPHEWPWLYAFLIFVQAFFIIHRAGNSLGLDALLARNPVGPFAGDGFVARMYRRFA